MTPQEAYDSPLGKALHAVMQKLDYDYLTEEDYPEMVTIMQQTLKDNDAGIYVKAQEDGWDW